MRILALAAVALLGAACGSGAGSATSPPTGSVATVASADAGPSAAGAWVTQRIHTGHRPCATLGAAGSIWVADINDADVKRLDPRTGATVATIKTDAGPCGMAYGAGAVWVENYTASTVTRINVASGMTMSVPVGSSPYDITYAGGAAWTTDYGSSTVTRIDAGTDMTTTITVGASPVGIAPAAGAVWVADSGSNEISRIDLATRKVSTIAFGGSPQWSAYAGDTVWFGDQGSGEVARLDARTGTIVRRSKVGPTPNDGDVFQGGVWFPDKDGSLYRIDQQTNAVSGPFALGAGNPFVVSGYAGRLWIADFGGTDTLVVDPSRLPPG